MTKTNINTVNDITDIVFSTAITRSKTLYNDGLPNYGYVAGFSKSWINGILNTAGLTPEQINKISEKINKDLEYYENI